MRANMNRRNMSLEQKAELREHQKRTAYELALEGRSQVQVAAMAGVSQQTISDWLGERTTDAGSSTLSETTIEEQAETYEPATRASPP